MTQNTIQFQSVPAEQTFLPSETLAVAAPVEPRDDFVENVEAEFPTDGPPVGPVFAPENEPVTAGTTFPSLEGTRYYRPVWRIKRQNPAAAGERAGWIRRADVGRHDQQPGLRGRPAAEMGQPDQHRGRGV
jgi:hypothetical protein